MEAVFSVHWKKKCVLTQPEDEFDREHLAGFQHSSPCQYGTGADSGAKDAQLCSMQEHLSHSKQLKVDMEGGASMKAETAACATVSVPSSCLDDDCVVDMGQLPQIPNMVFRVQAPGPSELDQNISFRRAVTGLNDVADILTALDIKTKGSVSYGGYEDVVQLLTEQPWDRGVICNDQVLHSENGYYREGKEYTVFPSSLPNGAFGEVVMCQDVTTKKICVLKKLKKGLSKNEVAIPLMFQGNPGIPQVYGLIKKGPVTEIFQEFAGLSLKNLVASDYGKRLCDPTTLTALAFQGFATLDKLHSKGIAHLDIKPENLCVDVQEKVWRLKLIDFGSSQTPEDQATEGLTNEYLSPESCNTILRVAKGLLSREDGRLGVETDVWALSLSLLYCIYKCHVMIHLFTGEKVYQDTDPAKLQAKRVQCLIEIAKLTDADVVGNLVNPSLPEGLRTLLMNTLRVSPKDRWTARQAAHFILGTLKGGVRLADKPLVEKEEQVPMTASSSCFSGVTLRVRAPQAAALLHMKGGVQESVQQSAAPACPAQIPDFDDLLQSEVSKKATRPYRRRCGEGVGLPYPQPSKQGYKVMRK